MRKVFFFFSFFLGRQFYFFKEPAHSKCSILVMLVILHVTVDSVSGRLWLSAFSPEHGTMIPTHIFIKVHSGSLRGSREQRYRHCGDARMYPVSGHAEGMGWV